MKRAFALALGVLALRPRVQRWPERSGTHLEIPWSMLGGNPLPVLSPTWNRCCSTGYPGNGARDAKRIFSAARKRIRQIVMS